MRPFVWAWLSIAVFAACTPPPKKAADSPDAGGSTTAAEEPVAPDPLSDKEIATQSSPRATLAHFLISCRAGNFADATGDLDIPERAMDRSEQLVRRLCAVFDQQITIDLSEVSRRPEGRLKDGLPEKVEEIAKIAGPAGAPEPLRLFRSSRSGPGLRWVFSRATVERIDVWYAGLDQRWILDHAPAKLLGKGPADLAWWQWIALLLLIVASMVLGQLFGLLTRWLFKQLAREKQKPAHEALLPRLTGPLVVSWTFFMAYLLHGSIGLPQRIVPLFSRTFRVGFFVVFFWVLLRGIGIVSQAMMQSTWAANHPSARALIPVGARIGKVLTVVVAIIAVLSELEYPVSSLIAGLGIGGLAMALAAQKTVENLFGAFSIGVDQPFREGDLVRIEDHVGVVERIGLRSTRVRTMDRTAITWPNGKLADMRLESLSARDRIRLTCKVRVTGDVRGERLRRLMDDLRTALRAQEKIWSENLSVQIVELKETFLEIEVSAWALTTDLTEYSVIRQETLIALTDIVRDVGGTLTAPSEPHGSARKA